LEMDKFRSWQQQHFGNFQDKSEAA
jgi:hypothetical protein